MPKISNILSQFFLKEKKGNTLKIEEQKSKGWDILLHTTRTVVLEFFRIVVSANSIFYLPFSKTGSNNSFFSLLSASSWEGQVGKESQILGNSREMRVYKRVWWGNWCLALQDSLIIVPAQQRDLQEVNWCSWIL